MTDLISHRAPDRLTFRDAIQDPAIVTHLRGDANYCWVYYADNRRTYLICRTLKEIEDYLPTFLRVSKQHLVNPAFIDHLLVGVPSIEKDLVLTTGVQVRLSRRRNGLLKKELAAYPRWPKPIEGNA